MKAPKTRASVLPEVEALEVVVRRLVRDELRGLLAHLVDEETREYSSRRGHGPPGYAHRVWQAIAKRIGVKRGRWFVVTGDALDEYEAKQRASAAPAPAPPANDSTAEEWSPRAALAAAGLRRQRA